MAARLDELRTVEQNRMMWSLLSDVAEQVPWVVNGQKAQLQPEDWKDIFTAGLTKTQRVAQGIEGGWVLLGQRTSRMSKGQLSELIELILAFGAEHGVRWSDETDC